ncbi:hypothetical protein TWF718_010140 [Orbilia javanica]|uniref:F-box domain-containing protein n=1 Tax=Orbilia javanica TaxID=47235 RepID=A0AAN8R9T4_9PEZI
MSETGSLPVSPLLQLTLDDSEVPQLALERPWTRRRIHSLPLELRILILSYLDAKQVKEFSLCSHACRAASLPIMYRRLRLSYDDSLLERPVTPTSRLEQIRAAFFNEGGSLYNLQDVVRHVTVDTEKLPGFNNIITYYRTWVSLLPLFPALNSLKILYYSPSACAYSPNLYEFDIRLFNGTFSRLMETCPSFRTLKSLYVRTSDYRFRDPSASPTLSGERLSDEDEIFMGLNPGESILKFSTMGTIPCPPALEEAYFDIDFRTEPRKDVIHPLIFIRSSMPTLKKLGVWVDLHTDRVQAWARSKLFPNGVDMRGITELGLCLDFLNLTDYATELERRLPYVETLSLYVDEDSHGGFWEEQAIKSYGRLVAAWPRTLKKMRAPWFTVNGSFERQRGRTHRIKSWFDTNGESNLEMVMLVKETTGDQFEATDCTITKTDSGREFKWSEIYLTDKLPLDGL